MVMPRFRAFVKQVMPEKYHALIYFSLRSLWYFGFRCTCPICNRSFRGFLPSEGKLIRPNAQCPGCNSMERHRLLWLYLRDRTKFFADQLKVLDVASPPGFQEKCKKLKKLDYISADISCPAAMVEMDITDIKLPANQFDCIICYHVLEHIPEDEKAMRELFRVLKVGGWAILQVPIDNNRDKTFEDPSVVLPDERERVFLNKTHVRIYGRDYKDRLERAGFTVKLDDYVRGLEEGVINKYGLTNDEIIYFCTKPEIHNVR